MAWFAANASADADATLLEDLDMGETWTPMFADEAYTGTFDGNNKTVTYRITEESATFQGFFSQVGQGGTVKDLTVAGGIDISGSASVRDYHGGIAARNAGTIVGCSSAVAMTVQSASGACCGGVAGRNTGMIQACTNLGNVTALTCAGGIARREQRRKYSYMYECRQDFRG